MLEYLPIGQKIRIATNGTVVPSKDVLRLIKERRIEVRISDYGLSEYKDAVKMLEEELSQNGISYFLYRFTMGNGSWIDFGRELSRENNKKVVADRYWTCSFGRNCLTLENSILGYCSRSTIAPKIQGEYKYAKKDYLMLDRVKNRIIFKWKLLNYIYKKHPMNCCRYCYGMKGNEVKPAIQIKD